MMLPIMVTTLLAVSCSKKEEHAPISTEENSEQLVVNEWQGTYEGIVPCASCEGIKKELTMNADNSYRMVSEYLGEKEAQFDEQGNVEWDATKKFGTFKDHKDTTNVSVFRFENGSAYLVSEVGDMEIKQEYKLTKK
ncbi:copper resistance protein NlpE [Bergeyella zoohelcum]|nr:copper resistance protein NlpE [Bergeyella zoohelcum]